MRQDGPHHDEAAKLRSNLLTIALDALMMLYINGPSMEQVVQLVAADKDPAMASSPTVNLLELCKKALTKWKEQKARCPERSHPGVSRARRAAARNLPAHHNDNGDAHTFSVLVGADSGRACHSGGVECGG